MSDYDGAKAVVQALCEMPETATEDEMIDFLLDRFSKLEIKQRCTAKTKRGNRCKLNAKAGGLCHLHGGQQLAAKPPSLSPGMQQQLMQVSSGKCGKMTKDGKPCKIPVGPSGKCMSHG